MNETDAFDRPDGAPPGMFGPDGRPRFFNDPAMDRFVAVILNMSSEMWVMEERLRALEQGDALPDAAPSAQAFVERLFEPLRERR